MGANKKIKCELFHDNFQNYKRYGIPRAQLVIADIPYNLGVNAYGSSPQWYIGGRIRTEKARRLENRSLIPILISILPNIFISVTGF